LTELFRQVSATVVYVTHDQIEALTLANRVVVLDKGRIQQTGTPNELYRTPTNRFVAAFIGSPSMNLFEADFAHGRFVLGAQTIETGLNFSGRAEVGIRPEAIRLDPEGLPASISWVESLGMNMLIGLRVGSRNLTALATERPSSDSVRISFDPKEVHVFDKESGSNINHRRSRPA
jgi:ABC-type sugar transport system ATPase subunit